MPDDERDPDEAEYLADPEADDEEEAPAPVETPKRVRRIVTKEDKAVTLPVGQVETAETLHGEVRMTRSLTLGSRNDGVHFSVALPVVVQPGWSLAQYAVAAADMSGVVKSVVYSQLGLDYAVTEDGVMQEVLKAFPGAERVRDDRGEDDRSEPERGSNGHGRFPHPRDLDRPGHVDAEVWADLCSNYGDWFDNRRDKASGKYKSTAPDFKRAEDSQTVWLTPFRKPAGQSGGNRGYER